MGNRTSESAFRTSEFGNNPLSHSVPKCHGNRQEINIDDRSNLGIYGKRNKKNTKEDCEIRTNIMSMTNGALRNNQ